MIVASPRRAHRLAVAAGLLLGALALPGVARADAASAEALFREGRTLLDQRKYDAACPKLAESQRLDPGAGTLLALSLCHEGQGKTGTAFAELNDAAALGRKVGRNDLANAAAKRARAMEPHLAKVVVRVPHAEPADFEVKRDGQRVAPSEWGVAVPVDPGEHKVDVAARGKVARSYTVRLAGAGTVEIVVDKLEDERPVAVAAVPAITSTTTTTSADLEADATTGRGQRIAGLALIGVGVVGLGAGAYFGGKALSESSESKRACPTTPCAGEPPSAANERSKDSFKVSVISLSSGVAAIGVGALVYALAPDAPVKTGRSAALRRTRILPETSPTQVGLVVVGAF